jgi:putative chitinase
MSNSASLIDTLGRRGNQRFISALKACADDILEKYHINTPLRQAHFWAQAAHETAGFKYTHEIWGPTKAQKRYEGRKDLGNTVPGDGYKFRGRGIFQLTGRANYRTYGMKINVDLLSNPDAAAGAENALKIACEYWNTRGLSKYADANNIEAITKRINGGLNGLSDRKAKYKISWDFLSEDEERPKPAKTMAQSKEGNAAIVAGGAGVVATAKEVVSVIQEANDSLTGLTAALGKPLVIAMIVMILAAGAIWYWRWQRMKDDA